MESPDPLVEALRALCDANGGYKFVADKARVSADNLWQILAGVKLKSGKPRGVGPNLRDKLTVAYPDWLNYGKSSPVAAEPGAAYNVLTDRERTLLDNFRVLPDEDQALLFADIEARAVKTRTHIQKVLRDMGLTERKDDLSQTALPNFTAEQAHPGYPVAPGSASRVDLVVVKPRNVRTPTPTLDRLDERLRGDRRNERGTNRPAGKQRKPPGT